MEKVIFNKKSSMEYCVGNFVVELGKICGIVIGSFIFAYAINSLYRPFEFLSTGFNGISMMLNYLFGWSIALCSFILNIIFVVLGFRMVNRKFALLSILGITASSFFLELTEGMTLPIDNPIIAVVFGGLILGLGVGIALRCGGAIGGMNILAKIMNKYIGISIGTFDLCFNLVIIAIAAIVFDINMAMYTIMARYVATKTIDAIVEGVNKTKTVMIISDKAESIASVLIKNVGRGVTFIDSHGAYSGSDKHMIYCVVRLSQLGKLKNIVQGIDEKVFMTIIDTKEVYGNGFSN
jgi:uncharacterized membrane-anchored protein YitT (DUF2179 family)